MNDNTPPMRAITQQRFGSADELVLTTVPRPVPLPTEVLVRVAAAGVNPVDWKTRQGHGMAGVLGEPPFVLGWDVAGVVEEVGFGVTTLEAGDRVFGMPWFPRQAGGYAEYVTAPARQFAKTPDAVSDVEAAAVPLAALTAWQVVVDTAGVQAGDRVLITAGAGGVGHFAVQFAKYLGARVTATASSRNHGWLRELGADEVVDYHDADHLALIKDIDVVVELTGLDQVRTASVLRPGGLIVAVPSGLSGELAEAAAVGGFRASAYLVEPDGAALTTIGGLIADGAVRVEVAATFPLEQAAAAHELGETNRTRGKIVLEVP
ncbi:NADP-dependent oxidoreductase [Streptomyces sp. NPDC057249]|uniref:NADP-dependent oxidoreductase n=1 Tax=Streptomyces sp. NPDC057249 TaxID=3346067 RepID=UPI003639630C